jgi:hypothetical protein
MRVTPPKRGCAIALLIFFLLSIPGIFAMANDIGPEAYFILLVYLVFIALTILWMRSKKPLYHVVVASSSAESEALTSKDQGYVESIVNSINSAIVEYR